LPKPVICRLPNLSPQSLSHLCGPAQQHLKRIEDTLSVRISGQTGAWQVQGEQAETAVRLLKELAALSEKSMPSRDEVEHLMHQYRHGLDEKSKNNPQRLVLKAGRRNIEGKTPNQKHYLQTMQDRTLTLSVGPAGCGKTYLAVAAAVVALNSHQVERIILTRPAVEAGEKLGFLPGDLQQKVDPYLRPLFDALADMLGVEKMNALTEQGRIEIAPLAYMRGRTLNDAFIILDEAQNTTRAQMKMFLTRLGFSSKMVVTGDVTQVDLPHHQQSGLLHALKVLAEVKDIGICKLSSQDVVRHQLVESIVLAYDAQEHD